MADSDEPTPPRVYSFAECKGLISSIPPHEVIDGMAKAFQAYSRGMVSVAPIQTLGQPPLANFVGHPDAQACIKSAYVNGGDVFVTKVASGGGGLNSGLVMVFSQRTFSPIAIFLDGGWLTEWRTAAAGALAAQHFAPRDLTSIAVIGCGIQARWQLRSLASVVSCRRVRAWARRSEQVDALVAEMRGEGWEMEAAPSAEGACRGAGLIITVTPVREPLLRLEWVDSRSDVLITAIGADSVGKQELDPALVAAASLRVADSKTQCLERGEFQHAVRAGSVQPHDIVEMGDWLTQNPPASGERVKGLIIFDSTGVAVQDAQVAELALKAAGGKSRL